MKTLYFDCFSGISGDMTVAALLDLGVPKEYLISQLSLLNLDEFTIETPSRMKSGIAAQGFDVVLQRHDHNHRGLSDILKIIEESGLSPGEKRRACDIFTVLGKAESRVHGTTPDKIHFHEVGGTDSIVDIVSAAICLEYLKPGKIIFSPIRDGRGFVTCAHGRIPVPVPAVVEISREYGLTMEGAEVNGEMVTPTGAAIVAAMGDIQGAALPKGKILSCGYGGGTKDFDFPNLLRVLFIETADEPENTVSVIETQLDDETGETLGGIFEPLFALGALDVTLTPLIMKKNRPGQLLSVLCPQERESFVCDYILINTSAIGLRITKAVRKCLPREILKVDTRFGAIGVKVSKQGDKFFAKAEYEDAHSMAEKAGVTVRQVSAAAEEAAYLVLMEGQL